jgi:RNase P/RNase MRP subunit p29
MGRKIILKSICIFLLQLDEKNKFIINGNSMVYRPSDRIKHKFKFKKADKINHDFLETLDEIRQE